MNLKNSFVRSQNDSTPKFFALASLSSDFALVRYCSDSSRNMHFSMSILSGFLSVYNFECCRLPLPHSSVPRSLQCMLCNSQSTICRICGRRSYCMHLGCHCSTTSRCNSSSTPPTGMQTPLTIRILQQVAVTSTTSITTSSTH